jgi:hypothetical protein
MILDDLNVLFSGPDAVVVDYGSGTFKGILDTPDNIIGGGVMVSTQYALIIKTLDVSDAKEMDEITVAGELYEIREFLKLDDGLLSKLILSLKES